ncbi:MAG TPA: zinc ABC transporter substrate-binding protein [Longimicrobium sp.]|nr:zinc ABC transporter substrate-binding protein [Longimicrobium sp.]
MVGFGWIRSCSAALAAVVVALAAGGCTPPEPAHAEGRLQVVTTIGMIKDVVENVGGPRVVVTGLMGPGVDPHLYKASEGDVRKLFRADVVFYGGLHLEARMGEVLEEMGGRTRVVAVTDAIPRDRLMAPVDYSSAYDPHVWFDVALWAMTIETIERTLAEADPAHAAEYRARADAYRAELERLDRYVRDQAARVPRERRVLITAHDAFAYFGRAYGFEVRGLQGISTAAEAGTADVQALARFIAERRIPAVFVESSIPRRTIEAVQEAVRARGFEVAIGGSLYSDAMGTPGTPDGTYVGMVRHNIDTLVGALLGQPASPE